MKRLWHAYTFTLCLLAVGVVWVYLDISVTRKHYHSIFIPQDSLPGSHNTTEQATPIHSEIQFYNTLNNTVSQRSPGGFVAATSTAAAPFAPPPTEVTTRHISSVHIVVIVSYMRSGSTFTADVLQHFPGTVYVFEPFHTLMVRTRERKPLLYLNGTKRMMHKEDITDDFLMEEIHKWFNCRYTELDVYSLSDNFHTYFSRSMKKLTDCWRPKRHTLKSMRECLPGAIKMCENARHRLFKFIRLPMRLVHRVMNFYPKLQVIHLIRDPRGSLNSQVNIRETDWTGANRTSKERCTAIADDLNYTFSLIYYYPEQVRILIYETLARKPLEMARRLLTFLHYPTYGYVMRYISKLTSEGKKDSRSYGIIRGNSSKTAFSWRHKMNFSDVQIVDSNCQHVYNILGYRPMTSPDEVIDDSIPTHVSPETPGMF